MRVKVEQSGNTVEVSGYGDPIIFRVEGIDLDPINDHTFAAWLMLPWAMKTGEAIEIDGPVDMLAIENIKRFSNAWELWEPRKFHPIDVVSASKVVPTEKTGDLVFYSGGLDSTDMLLELGPQAQTTTALTVQGFDYSTSRSKQFAQLQDQVAPLLDELNYKHATLGISRVSGGYHSWSLQLAAAGFLFAGQFEKALFATDSNWEQDMSLFPWGSNHVTNRYLKGENFHLTGLCDDKTRAMKARSVARHPTAIHAASFCKNRGVRPKNCGLCSKCLRTKAMFLVFGEAPDIFIDGSFDASFLSSIDLNDRKEIPLIMDLCQIARKEGSLDRIPELQELLENLKRPRSTSSRRFAKLKRAFRRKPPN